MSWRIDAVFKEQSITLSDALSSMVSENLVGYQKILESAIVSTRQEMMQTSGNIARHPPMMAHAETLHVAELTDLFDSYKTDFDLPLKAFYEATGLPSAIYSGMYPIVHMGFVNPEKGGVLTGELHISKELVKKVHESDKPIQTAMTFAGISYCTICSVIKDADDREIGILLMAMPKDKIIESKEGFLSSSIEAKRNFQTWFNGFRAIALVVFVIVSWVISTTIANPINVFTRKVRAMAKGDLSIRTEMKRKDEIGVLSNAIDNMAEDLEATQAQLVQSAKLASIGELASGVAHELNQPLMVIRGNAQLINRSLRKGRLDPNKLIKRLEPVERNTKRMMNIIDHLRTFSRQSQTAFQPLNVNKIIDESFLMVGEQLRIRDIEVELDLDADLPKVKGDGNQLEQVFLNLITNARDAITSNAECKGRIEIITKKGELPNQQSTINNQQSKDFVEILIRDNGDGIPDDKLGKIFDPFFTTKEVGKGTGLGLSISYGIIQDHGGEIKVAETGPEGTTFRIRLWIDDC